MGAGNCAIRKLALMILIMVTGSAMLVPPRVVHANVSLPSRPLGRRFLSNSRPVLSLSVDRECFMECSYTYCIQKESPLVKAACKAGCLFCCAVGLGGMGTDNLGKKCRFH